MSKLNNGKTFGDDLAHSTRFSTKIKVIYHQGLMLIGEVTKNHGHFLLNNPLIIRPGADQTQIQLAPFGMGFFESPITIPDNIIISNASQYGVKQYLNAVIEINSKLEKTEKTTEKTEESKFTIQ